MLININQRFNIFLFLGFFFLLFSLISYYPYADAKQSDKSQNIISEILISGNKRVETELISLNINSKVGSEYSEEDVLSDIKSIYRLGFFDDVSVEKETLDEGVKLFYIVVEKPVVVDLRILGNDDINDDDIAGVIQFEEGKIINLKKVDESLIAIKSLYSQRGLVGTTVDYDIEPKGDGTVGVTYNIREGKKAYIKKVRFSGNENIESKKIKDRIYSQKKGIFSFVTQKGVYNEEEIKRDSERIRAVYLDNGYLDAKVSKPELNYLDDEDGYEVLFKIEEGNQYSIENIYFQGEGEGNEEKLSSLISLNPGDIFSSSKLSSDIAKITTFYGDKGFAFANVNPKFNLRRENLLVNITYEIEAGDEISIRNIDIVGNTRTRDKVIRRQISLQEQQLFNSSKVQSIKGQVTRLGFFEDNVEVETNRVPDEENLLDVNVKVQEKPTGFFSIAGGFSSVETVIFAGQVQESNLFGYGKSGSLNAQIGGVTKIFSINYQDLNFLDTRWTFNASAFKNDREFRDFDRDAFGGTIGFGRHLYKNLRSNITYRYEKLDIQDVDRDARLIITESKRTVSSLRWGLVWDSRNNFLDPTAGNLTRTSLEYAGPFGGDTDFIRYTASSRFWLPFWKSTYFSFLGRYGFLDLKDTGDDLVVGERFFLGGPNSLRGYAFRRVGPRVPTEDGDFVIVGGVQELLLQVDYIFPLLPSAGVKGVIFADIGEVFNDGEDLTLNPSDLRRDVGFGFRWLSPLGPLRLDIGFPIGDRLPDEDAFEIQFTVGSLF